MTTRRTADLHGILVAVATPFTPDAEAVDEDVLRAQADRLIRAGVHGLVTTGTTGEFPTLNDAEYRRVIAAVRRGGRPPGAGGGRRRRTLHPRPRSTWLGTPRRSARTPSCCFPRSTAASTSPRSRRSSTAVSDAISIPIVYYNIPSATGTHLTARQIADLGAIPGVDYLKDTSGDAVCLSELLVAHADRIQAFNGWDTLTFFGIASGARASVWGAAGVVPELAVRFWDTLAVKADLISAREQWRHLWAISDFLESVDYVAGVKAGLEIVGHPAGPPRPPVRPLPRPERERFTAILTAAGQVPGP